VRFTASRDDPAAALGCLGTVTGDVGKRGRRALDGTQHTLRVPKGPGETDPPVPLAVRHAFDCVREQRGPLIWDCGFRRLQVRQSSINARLLRVTARLVTDELLGIA
jgi:hypothetical protein